MTDDRPKGAGDNDLPSEDTRKLVRDIDELLRDSNRLREPVRAASCVSCGVTGRVDVTAFRWNGDRQLTWGLPRVQPHLDNARASQPRSQLGTYAPFTTRPL